MKPFFKASVVAILLCNTSIAIAAPEQPCRAFVQEVTKDALSIIQNKSTALEEKQQKLGVLFQKAVDTDWIGKFVAARAYKAATPAEQKSYLDTYRQYLTAVYVSKLSGENADSVKDITVGKLVERQPRKIQAITTIKRTGEADVNVEYLLRQDADSSCHVQDIVIENISLLTSHRSEFQDVASQGGLKAVIALMQQKLNN